MEWAACAAVVAASAAYSLRRMPMHLPIALAVLGVGGAAALAHRWYSEEDRRRKRDDEFDDGMYYCSQLPLPAATIDAADTEENKRRQSCTADIDESSAEGLCDAESYAKANAMLIQVPVLGTTKTFWRLSDEATRISKKLVLILRGHHSAAKYLTAPLQVSNVWISSLGSVKLRGVSFTDQGFGIKRVRDDYKHLSEVLRSLIRISGGDITKLPPDYKEFLTLLESDTLEMEDEFLIVNSSALLPMENWTRKRDDEFDDGLFCSQLPLPAAATDAVDSQEKERRQSCTTDIDESSAEGLCDAESYAKANVMLIQVPVLGTTKTFWRLSDEATRISRKLALILRSHHSVGKYLTAPLQVSNVWISSSGSVKLRGVSFTDQGFGIKRVRHDYKHLSRVLRSLIRISGGDVTKLPPDYMEFLRLLGSDTLAMKDEFLIVNNSALLPMKNRTEVFLMLYDRIK